MVPLKSFTNTNGKANHPVKAFGSVPAGMQFPFLSGLATVVWQCMREFSLFFNTPQLTNSRLPFATNTMDNVVADGFTRDVSKQISELPAA